ncbi:MAG: response regulator transcription factor [Flavobacterium sp.]|nr:response regulator transcription factor [Flavobacterium sp.]
MIKMCVADNQPIVHYGIKNYFEGKSDFSIVANVKTFDGILETIENNFFDVLIVDLELDGFSTINLIKSFVKNYPKTKVLIFSGLTENMYAPNAIKAGASTFISKNNNLEALENAIIRVQNGEVFYSQDVKKKIDLITKQTKKERLYKKLSSREIEVLRFLSAGRKNKEIAETLNLNEKTISTYKLRLLNKLNVTNLVDLVNKAKTLDVL